MTTFCHNQHCEHAEEEHDESLLFCNVAHCRCTRFISEDELDDESDEPQPLNFD